ncbi:MAG TPA: hypothetical protein VNO18_09625 [Xanthobacteraceae bacterium]|jgi:hypothetical protein|nr:hypothetical protein [Xanthobacteraceae bacterium]
MKIVIENTAKIVRLQLPSGAKVPARVWQGHVVDDGDNDRKNKLLHLIRRERSVRREHARHRLPPVRALPRQWRKLKAKGDHHARPLLNLDD